MDPYSIPPVNPSSASSAESDAADEARADERRHERSHAFRQAIERAGPTLGQPAGPPTAGSSIPGRSPAGPLPGGMNRGSTLPITLLRDGAASQPAPQAPAPQVPLDPALVQTLMRMQAEGIDVPAPLLKLLSAPTDSPKPAKAAEQEDVAPAAEQFAEESVEAEASAETVDPAMEARRSQAKLSRMRDGDNDKQTASSVGAKSDSADDPDAPTPEITSTPAAMIAPQTPSVAPESRVPPPPELVQQLVEFATVGRNQAGLIEFRLGLVRNALGGLRIQIAAYGNRRVGLTVKGGAGKSGGIGDAEIAGLIDALRSRNVEVVDVILE